MNRTDAEEKANCNVGFSLLSLSSFFFLFVTVSLWLSITAACSIPNLESEQCTAARDNVRKFYSFHFGNDMHPSAENLKAREKFLTPSLTASLTSLADEKRDYFTASDDYPKAFRVGACRAAASDRSEVQVLLFWKDDQRSEQREIWVETVRENNDWRINKVTAGGT
jgi:hypothetical protein